MVEKVIIEEVDAKALAAKRAARKLALAPAKLKSDAILAAAAALEENRKEVLFHNEIDLQAAEDTNLSPALIDRLKLDDKRISSMVKALEEISGLNDPVGEVIEKNKNPLGFELQKIRVPLGLIGIIYESRPNVTVDSTALCLKAGNAVMLKGGREAANTNRQLYQIVSNAVYKTGVPEGAVQFIETSDRHAVDELIRLDNLVDLIIARGSEEMIRAVREKSVVPVLGHGKGLCHTYVDAEADVKMAVEIAFNAKVHRPGVCNAMESLLIHKDIAAKVVPDLFKRFKDAGVEIRGCGRTRELASWVNTASDSDYKTEYLDLKLSSKIVDSVDEAISHINRYGSGHSEAIVTSNVRTAERFLREVDAAAVFHNASTRLHDGGVFGLGAEIGISTQKLHARGTMGVKELTTTKYIIKGSGQVRN